MAKKKNGRKNRVQYSPKQMRVAQAVLSGDLRTKAKNVILADAGYSEALAKKNPKDVFSSEGVQNALVALGVTPEVIATPAIEAMEAKKGSFYQGQYYDTDEPDHIVRLKGADQLADILGLKKQVIEQKSVNVNVDYGEIADIFG